MKVLYSENEIAEKVDMIAEMINQDFKSEQIILIGVLKGSFIFLSDLTRALFKKGKKDVVVDFLTVSSYGNKVIRSGKTRVLSDLSYDIAGKNVVVVEDVADTGHTLVFLQRYLEAKGPTKLKFAVMLDKIEKREVDFTPDYIGFTLKGKPWIEGYGLDTKELYRGNPEIIER